MCFRLKGGARHDVPGSWTCMVCNMGGCQPVRQSCFRCGTSRGTAPPVPAGRETRYPGKGSGGPQNSACPTTRHAKPKPKPVGLQTEPQLEAPSQSTPPKLDTPTLLQVLQSPGLGQDLLARVEVKLSPPPRKEPEPEKRLTTLVGKITMCRQQMDKLRKQCDHTVKLFLELDQNPIEKCAT